jgi:hypothetical protein
LKAKAPSRVSLTMKKAEEAHLDISAATAVQETAPSTKD